MSYLQNCEMFALATAAELVILSLAVSIFFRRQGHTFAEASACGLVTTLMMLSLILQLSFIVHLPKISLFLEIFLTVTAVGYLVIQRHAIWQYWSSVWTILSNARFIVILISIILFYLAFQALMIPPHTLYWQPLGQILGHAHYQSLFPVAQAGLSITFSDTFSPINAAILPYLFLRFQTDIGVGLLGFMAYLSIGFSAYALSRRYAWPPTAATASIIIISMPRLVYLSTSPGYEIIPVSTALFCLLVAFRAVESPNLADLYLLCLGILFMISGTYMNLVFPLILIPLFYILLIRRHGANTWWQLIISRPYLMLLFLIPAVVFSQVWLVVSDSLFYKNSLTFSIPSSIIALNEDGIQGALANAIRYILQSAHFTRPVDSALDWATNFSLIRTLQQINDNLVMPIFGNSGSLESFRITWLPNEKLSWFGPFGFLLVLPAVGYAARRAPRRLKAVSIALIGYLFLVSLIPAWHPENVRYFSMFFVCGGICISFFLPPWRMTRNRRRFLVFISVCLLLYGSTYNDTKPAFGWPSNEKIGGIWIASNWGLNRSWLARNVFDDNRLEVVKNLVPENNPIWLIYTDFSLTYPFLLHYSQARLFRLADINPEILEKWQEKNAKMIMFVDCSPPSWLKNSRLKTLWTNSPENQNRPGSLVQTGE